MIDLTGLSYSNLTSGGLKLGKLNSEEQKRARANKETRETVLEEEQK